MIDMMMMVTCNDDDDKDIETKISPPIARDPTLQPLIVQCQNPSSNLLLVEALRILNHDICPLNSCKSLYDSMPASHLILERFTALQDLTI